MVNQQLNKHIGVVHKINNNKVTVELPRRKKVIINKETDEPIKLGDTIFVFLNATNTKVTTYLTKEKVNLLLKYGTSAEAHTFDETDNTLPDTHVSDESGGIDNDERISITITNEDEEWF